MKLMLGSLLIGAAAGVSVNPLCENLAGLRDVTGDNTSKIISFISKDWESQKTLHSLKGDPLPADVFVDMVEHLSRAELEMDYLVSVTGGKPVYKQFHDKLSNTNFFCKKLGENK